MSDSHRAMIEQERQLENTRNEIEHLRHMTAGIRTGLDELRSGTASQPSHSIHHSYAERDDMEGDF